MVNLLKRIGGALKDAVVRMFGLQAVFGPGTGETKNEEGILRPMSNAQRHKFPIRAAKENNKSNAHKALKPAHSFFGN